VEEEAEASPPASSTSVAKDRDDHAAEIERDRLSAEAAEAKEKLKLAQSQAVKSRKMVALLQSQLTDANSKRASEKEGLEAEVSELKEQLAKAQRLKEELEVELADLKAERAELLKSTQAELEQLRGELEGGLQRVPSAHQQRSGFTPIPKSGDMLGSLSSFQHAQSPMQSVSTVPMAALEEGLCGHHASQILMSSSGLIGDDDQLSSLEEQSIISMDPAPLGSPLQPFPLSPDAGSLAGMHPMLAVSRLSHHSTMGQVGWKNSKIKTGRHRIVFWLHSMIELWDSCPSKLGTWVRECLMTMRLSSSGGRTGEIRETYL
jgi:hypothetical protein